MSNLVDDVIDTCGCLLGGLIILAVIALLFGFSFLMTAGLVWVACWALALIDITIAWSWTLSLAVWILSMVVRALFGTTVRVKK